MKTAAIITIGDELLIGQVTNTNAAFMGQKLSEIGIEVTRTVVVGDQYDEIMNVFREYHGTVDAVLVTGGLVQPMMILQKKWSRIFLKRNW